MGKILIIGGDGNPPVIGPSEFLVVFRKKDKLSKTKIKKFASGLLKIEEDEIFSIETNYMNTKAGIYDVILKTNNGNKYCLKLEVCLDGTKKLSCDCDDMLINF